VPVFLRSYFAFCPEPYALVLKRLFLFSWETFPNQSRLTSVTQYGGSMKIALTVAAGLLAVSSFAFAADNNGGNNNGAKDGMKADQNTTGSVDNNDGNTVPLEGREFCLENPGDSKCQKLGGETNQ
jgi:hypothetical protein